MDNELAKRVLAAAEDNIGCLQSCYDAGDDMERGREQELSDIKALSEMLEDADQQTLNRRQRVWLDVWAGTASAFDCKSPATATKYADAALEEFDKRWPEKTPDNP